MSDKGAGEGTLSGLSFVVYTRLSLLLLGGTQLIGNFLVTFVRIHPAQHSTRQVWQRSRFVENQYNSSFGSEIAGEQIQIVEQENMINMQMKVNA